MNIYFLVEGKTERKVYPKWMSYLVPRLERVFCPSDAIKNNYYLVSGGGFPSILDNHLMDSLEDIHELGNYDYFVLAIDTDNTDADIKIKEVDNFIRENNIVFNNLKFIVIPQVVCMETWFLGNRHIYSRNPISIDSAGFTKHYNIALHDPEQMQKPEEYNGTIGDYHYQYLRTMLIEKNIRYSKSNPNGVTEPYYIHELQNRLNLNHDCLKSLRNLFNFFALAILQTNS
jgi:hypothetical protein